MVIQTYNWQTVEFDPHCVPNTLGLVPNLCLENHHNWLTACDVEIQISIESKFVNFLVSNSSAMPRMAYKESWLFIRKYEPVGHGTEVNSFIKGKKSLNKSLTLKHAAPATD